MPSKLPNLLSALSAVENHTLRCVGLWERCGSETGELGTMISGSCPALLPAPGFVVTDSRGTDSFTWSSEPSRDGDTFRPCVYRGGHRRPARSHSPKTMQQCLGRPRKATGLSPGSDATASPPHVLCSESPSRSSR